MQGPARMEFEDMDETDRISSLPDCLLHHILFSFETKESVRTSVLSKRWVDVWKSVPRLDLDASEFNDVETFENFVNSIFQHKLSPEPEQLDSFTLKWTNCNQDNYHTLSVWIWNLVPMNPREVYIEIAKLRKIYFVSYLFDCPSLESLFLWPQLDGAWSGFEPPVINLPFLKILSLGWLCLDDECIHKLISGCPVLEELTVEKCYLGMTQKITSSTMKTLVILNSVFGEETRLIINMPNLKYLSCQVHFGRVSFENLMSLEYANINIWGRRFEHDGTGVQLLRGLSNVNSLQLSGLCCKFMLEMEASPTLPVFERLESLDLVSVTLNKFTDPIISFFRRTPNLERLTLRHVRMENSSMMAWGAFHEILCRKLKTVEIVCLKSYENVYTLVEYLRSHFWTIENISINFTDEIDTSYDFQDPGDDGDDGDDMDDGANGADMDDGANGADMDDGAHGADMDDGADGADDYP